MIGNIQGFNIARSLHDGKSLFLRSSGAFVESLAANLKQEMRDLQLQDDANRTKCGLRNDPPQFTFAFFERGLDRVKAAPAWPTGSALAIFAGAL